MSQEGRTSSDLVRSTLQLLSLAALIALSFWIMRPFLPALGWAGTIVIATWPLMLRVQGWFGGRRGAAVAVMTIILLLVLLVPLYLGVDAIVGNVRVVSDWSKSVSTLTVPQPPSWLESVPLLGAKVAAKWQQLASAGPEELATHLAPFVRQVMVWFVGQVGSVGMLILQFLLTVIVAAIMYVNGEVAARGITRFAVRLSGARGEEAVQLAAQSIRGVALGVVLTALVQASLTAIGLITVDVPFAPVLSAVALILCIAQIGPAILLIPVVVWVYKSSGSAWGTGFLIWSLLCCTIDNVMRPVLIKRGADLPLLLVFSGVIGGLFAFGIIGLFLGPVVLAVGYTLLGEWVSDATVDSSSPGSAGDSGPEQ